MYQYSINLILKQAITEINLSNNEIGDDGMRYLTDALRNNTVRVFSFYSFI